MARGPNGKHAGGRPSKFEKRIAARFLKAVSKGLIRKHAALCAGVHIATLQLWAKKGKEAGKGKLYEFFVALKKAESLAQEARAQTIIVAARKNWQAAAWWLERKYPEIWGRKEVIDLNGKIKNQNLNVNLGQGQLPTKEELVELLRQLVSDEDVIDVPAKHLTNGDSNGHT